MMMCVLQKEDTSLGTEAEKTAAIGSKPQPEAICQQLQRRGKLVHENSPFEAQQAPRGADVGPLLEMRLRSQQVFAQRRRMEEQQSQWMGNSLAQYNSPILQHPLTPKEASKDKYVTKPRKTSRINQFGDGPDMGRFLGCKRSEKQEERAKQTRSGYVLIFIFGSLAPGIFSGEELLVITLSVCCHWIPMQRQSHGHYRLWSLLPQSQTHCP